MVRESSWRVITSNYMDIAPLLADCSGADVAKLLSHSDN
ncbi:Uncharacterised protein [Nocardia cyriacigeorgica]|uniref:Uncharacterized protein n=1 Tax=Nocardia cyriacigeorgica TaxID=135487 RepID=A0A4U8VSQ8_9NOCA|nr:Uncharacterised protein [Nocardia cyriacigeorgica]